MAQLTSLGIHTPVALPYMVTEGLLPPEPGRHLYQWETYVSDDGHGDTEEEVLATKNSVAWSQGKFVRNVYRFDLETEEVTQALLTKFPDDNGFQDQQAGTAETLKVSINGSGSARLQTTPSRDSNSAAASNIKKDQLSASKALVVFLKTKAHVYFLHGTHHIVDLPFEVKRAFAAPRGVIIERRSTPTPSLPGSPTVPVAPPNSFFSSQLHPTSSYLQSPTIAKSFASTQTSKPSPLSGKSKLDGLFQDVLGSPGESPDDDLASLYSLTNPLSDVGVVSYSVQQHKPRLSSRSQSSISVDFEPLDVAEEVVYVSSSDELGTNPGTKHEPLALIVTANKDIRALSIWHAWYLSEKTLSSLLRQRAAAKSAKARRRSSFLSAGMGTGATTPAVRHREGGARESFAAAGTVRAPGETRDPSNARAASTRRKTRQEEEEAMASQMDPDFQPSNSQQTAAARESRRISSLNAEVRAGQHQPAASFGNAAGRRNTSFGWPGDRKSVGHRKSRGSTPGSVLSRSLGGEDDLMNLDNSIDGDESAETIIRHIRATFEAGGAEGIIGPSEDSFKRDLVVRKIHSITMTGTTTPASTIRVFTLRESELHTNRDHRGIGIYIHEGLNEITKCYQLLVRTRPLFPELSNSLQIPIPILIGEKEYGTSTDMIKVRDGPKEAILLADRGFLFSPKENVLWLLPSRPPYRHYDLYDIPTDETSINKEIGRNRTLTSPERKTLRLEHPGLNGRFDEVAEDAVHHRVEVQLQPKTRLIRLLLKACQVIFPPKQESAVPGLWCMAHDWLRRQPERLNETAEEIECVAFATTVFAFASNLFDDKTRAAPRVARVAAGDGKNRVMSQLRRESNQRQSFGRSAWSLLEQQKSSSQVDMPSSPSTERKSTSGNDQFLVIAAALADEMLHEVQLPSFQRLKPDEVTNLMLALHIVSEELKLSTVSAGSRTTQFFGPLITQLGSCLGAVNWSQGSCPYYDLDDAFDGHWKFLKTAPKQQVELPFMDNPVGIYHWFEHALNISSGERYPTLDVIATIGNGATPSKELQQAAREITPRLSVLSDMVASTSGLSVSATDTVLLMSEYNVTLEMMETLPEAIAAPLRDAISKCEMEPPTTWPSSLLSLVGREDLTSDAQTKTLSAAKSSMGAQLSPRDVQAVCNGLDHHPHTARTKEANRHAVSQLIFSEDRRLVEATNLMHYNSAQVAECPKEPDWTDAQHLEQQRKVMQYVTTRMIALPSGDAMIHFDSQNILLTDKYHLTGFSNSCLMQPMGHTLTTDRSGLTEEKVNWAYFHAGVSAGLRISKNVVGIDTSWIAFNKPNELTNRHAGLLLALGLSGHLRQLAKWLSFKYLTPKHTMTSVGLLLGLSASYMGTMDGLIIRMLSVHITRMLPPGAAELNVSPITQTAGLVGIGLLYYNTQHRRMSEIMLSEIEHMEAEDPDSGPDPLRDESYRLAAGMALGFINLGIGRDLHGLHGMHLPERLLAVAVGPRPVSAVHIFDKATAGAVIAIALVYMKSNDMAVAKKIDIPDTEAQFDHVRPDMLMLRAMAKQIIMWDSIEVSSKVSPTPSWTRAKLPSCYRSRFNEMEASNGRHPLRSSDVPFFNITTGLAWALSLKYAGSGNTLARDEILNVLDCFYMVRGGVEAHYYDAKLTRSTVRRCIDVLALAAATVMAGTGDVQTFRYLRRLHGRTDAETPYGSHLAAHLAIGVLFLGGGTFTFGTSDLAVASLICAFYPLFPTDVHDNHVHLQALRHLWVFAAEARCLVVEEADTQRPISMPIVVTLRDGSTKALTAPCLLPQLDSIATVHTSDPAYWRVTLDFQSNPEHLSAFRQNQRIFVRRCPASEAHNSVFSTTLAAMNDAQSSNLSAQQIWHTVFNLPAFKELDKASIELILPPDAYSAVNTDERGTVVDDRLILAKAATSGEKDALWNLRVLFAWAEKAREEGQGQLRGIGSEVVEALEARIDERMRDS